ncbi:MAG: 5'-nucleotidase C-terminal domain-containing protein [Methylotenera sp.]
MNEDKALYIPLQHQVRRRHSSAEDGAHAQFPEDALSRLILSNQWQDTGLTFSNGWRYGVPILPGNVTMEHLWNMVPTDSPISSIDISGDELRAMLKANLERTYADDPYLYMGRFVKRCPGLNMFFKIENPAGHRIEELIVGGSKVKGSQIYREAMLGGQGTPLKYGSNRQKLDVRAIEALQRLFSRTSKVTGKRRGSVVAI